MIHYNDPIYVLIKIFESAYPDKKAQIDFVADLKKNTHAYGETCWAEDGNVYIQIDIQTPMYGLIEVLGHELAHVAVGADAAHNAEWEKEFNYLNQEFNKVMKSVLDDGVSIHEIARVCGWNCLREGANPNDNDTEKKMWLVLQEIKGIWNWRDEKWEDGSFVTEIGGIFETEEKAVAACRDENYYIMPLVVNKQSPHESNVVNDCYYPKRGCKQ